MTCGSKSLSRKRDAADNFAAEDDAFWAALPHVMMDIAAMPEFRLFDLCAPPTQPSKEEHP
jgi:hypothetical protein